MRVVCQQPNYFPWLGYFEQIAACDAFVFLDDVQWIRQGRQHRTRIPTFASSHQEKNWLTVPVLGHGHRDLAFRELRIDGSRRWPRQHWNTLQSLYGRFPYFRNQFEPMIRPFLEKSRNFRFLIDLCESSTSLFWKAFDLKATVWHSSHLAVSGKKTERLVEICQSLEATEYYAALGSSRYLNLSMFREKSIRVSFQHFRYSAGPDPLRPSDYSVLDWLALEPLEKIRERLGKNRGSALLAKSAEISIDGDMRPVNRLIH